VHTLMIAPEPFFEPRGVPFSVYQQIRALSALGHRIDLLTYPYGEPVAIPGLRIYRLPRLPFMRGVKIGPSWTKLVLDGLLFCWACWRLCRQRYDALCSHEEAGVMGVVLAALFRCRHIYYMHSDLAQQAATCGAIGQRPLLHLIRRLQTWVIQRADAVAAICPALEQVARRLRARGGVHLIENVAIAVGDESEKVPAPSSRQALPWHQEPERQFGPIVLYTGTLERYQGVELLLRSAVLVRRRYPTVRYLIVGGQDEQVAALRALSQELEIEDCVRLLGPRPAHEMAHYMDLAAVLVSPRCTGNNVPLKLATYLRSGRPVLATAVPAHTQILHAGIALLVPPTAQGLAAGTLLLLQDPGYAQELAAAAACFARVRWSWSLFVEQQRRLYSEPGRLEERRLEG
jgi:glycosyltransferase involved in cell wall biosynthesis